MESADSLALSEDNLDNISALNTEPFPLTAAQRGLWFAQHLMPDVPITIANYIDVQGDLVTDRMRHAGERAAAELGAGSLRLIEIDGEPHQYVDDSIGAAPAQIDFRHEQDPEQAALEWMRAAYSQPIDLIQGPLMRAATLRIADDRTFWYSHVHHLALDGYGAVRLMNRAAEIYSALATGEEPAESKAGALEDVYGAEESYRTSARFEKDRLYWREKTQNLPAPISPTGIFAPPAPRSRICGEPLPDTLERALTHAIERLDSAFAPIAVAAVAAFLSRLTGAEDVVLSLPVAGRTTALLRRSGGMVSNVLPIRVRIDPDTTVASLVGDVQLELTGALRHQRYRAEDIRRETSASQEHRGFFGPAINIMAYEKIIQFGPETGYFNVLSTGPVEDLSINIYPPVAGGRSRIDFEANPNVYSGEVFEDLYRRFIGLLAQFLSATPDSSVLELDILDEAETAAIVPARGGAPAPSALLPDILGRGVQINPDGIALIEGDRQVTYAELDSRSNAVARALLAHGGGVDGVVAVALPRSIDSVVAFWAAAKSGFTFLPIDPTYPVERISHMLVDSGVQVGLSTLALTAELHDSVYWLAFNDPAFADELAALSNAPISALDRPGALELDHAAYMIYTSGSTGTPKGVVVTHRGLGAFTAEQRPELHLTSDARVLRFSSSSFDASIFEMLVAFSAGATMVIAPADVYGGSELTSLLSNQFVTHIITAPALLSTVEVEQVVSLESVVVGGDVCPPDLVERLGGLVELRNSYGPTESTIVITMTEQQTDPRAITIGTPLQGACAVVLDQWLRPAPVGMTGELYVGGPGLARGYHRREAQTSTRFIADPYGSGTRLYRTGDIVRWRSGKTAGFELEFVGRSDFQVQLNGVRVELGEVDAVLSWHQSTDFVVSTIVERGGRSILVSHIKVKPGHEFDPDSLLALASEFLPPQMVPVHLVQLDSVPLTPSGKLDRSALPDPLSGTETVPFRSASGPIQQAIAGAMAEVLGRDTVGIDDSFFALGGDSIVAIQLVSRAKASGIVFTPRDVFERRTVAGLADVAVSGAERIHLEELPGGGVGTMPLLPIAHNVLARSATESDVDSFYQALVLTAPTDVDTSGLLRTVAAVLDHHDMLRARLIDDGLEVSPRGSVDATSVVSEETSDDIADVVRRAGARLRPRDGVMLQIVHVANRSRIVVVAHHLVIDGVSWRILVPDLAAAWSMRDGSVVLPEVETSMRRWAHAVTQQPASEDLEGWLAVLGDPETLLGNRALDNRDTGSSTEHVEFTLAPEETDALLGALANAYRMGPEDALLTALTMALSKWRQERSAEMEGSQLILVESHGRAEDKIPGADLNRTLGWFTTAHPVRVSLAADVAAAQAVTTVKEQLRAIPSLDMGYGLLRESGALDGAPSPQISFNYLGRIVTHIPDSLQGHGWIPDLSVSADIGSGEKLLTESVLDINVVVSDGAATARIGFPTGVLSRDEVRDLAGHWSASMSELAGHALSGGAGALTPSDVPLVDVDQSRINQWQNMFGSISDILPLAPLQRGLLFHADLTRGSLDVYTAQIVFELGGDIDASRLRRAAQALLDRHDNLRTAFVHDARGIPVQVVQTHCEVPWREEHTEDAHLVIDEERSRRFDMSMPPLIRFALVHSADGIRLVVTNHHILFDGWSMPIFIKDLLVLYATNAPIAVPARPYREYLQWLSQRDAQSSLRRWTTFLDGQEEPTLLAGTVLESSAPPEDVAVAIDGHEIAALAERLAVTVNTVVQTAWSIVLSSLLSRSDIVFGATVSGRPGDLSGATDMLGLFINTLPLRVQTHVSDTVETLAQRIQREQVELLDVHHVGLAEISAAVGPGAAFDTLAVFESYPIDHNALGADTDIAGMRVRGIDVVDSTHYPLTLVTVLEPTPTMTLRFSPDAFSAGQVTTFAERLQRVLAAMATAPAGRIIDIDVLGALERRAVTDDWNATSVDLDSMTLADLLAETSSEHSANTSVVFEGRSLTYENFAARVACLARFLISRHIGPESIVGVSMPRSIEQLIAIHAVVHAGGAFLPLDPTLPAARIAHMIDTAAPTMILGSRLDSSVPVVDPRTLDLSAYHSGPITDWERLGTVLPGNTAYILFTSGSTGAPKGVAVSHGSIVNRLLWMQDTYPLDETDVVLHKTPTSFDVSVWELFWPHLTGASTVIAEPEGHRDPKYLSWLIRDERVTIVHFVPSMLDLFLEHGDTADCTSLRHIFASGEALPRTSVQRAHRALGASLHNLYGPTEAAVDVTYHRTESVDTGSVPIGVPVWNTQVRVLDSALRTVPIGAVGELYLSGVQLARGYVCRAALTSDRFVADPFNDGGRLYRTGDLVRWTLDGELLYMGRNDFQVKLRGQRLELGEIEASVLRTPGVTNAVVTVRGSGSSERLVAYVCGTADLDTVQAHVESELPAFMTPSVYVPLARMPLGRSGKLDRSALPEPASAPAEIVPPSGETETAIAQIFSDVLDGAHIGVTTSWFELGGNSLSAAQVVARINAELGVDLSVRDLFDNPTVRGLAGRTSSNPARGTAPGGLPLVARPRLGRIPLSPNQHRMWLLNRFDPQSGAYNMAGAVRLTGMVDAKALIDAVFDVVERHEALRTMYPDSAHGTHQVVTSSDFLDIRITDTTEAALTGALVSLAARGFDVTERPPVRAAIFRLAPDEHVLVVVTHHIAADGWSMRPLARDIMIAYASRVQGLSPQWSPLPVQYADYALWKLDTLGDDADPESVSRRQLDYWTQELDGVPERLVLPTDRPHPAVASHHGDAVAFSVSEQTRRSIRELAQRTGTTQFMVLHAAVTVLLARLSGERDITVGTPVAGRGERALDDLVGMFVGTLTLRTEVNSAATFADLLNQVRDKDLAAYSNADVPFDRVVEVLAPARSTAHHPLFQVMLSLDDPTPSVELPELTVTPLTAVGAVAKFDLQLEIDADNLSGTFTYATDIFDRSTVESFVDQFGTILKTVTDHSTTIIGDIALPEESILRGTSSLRRRTLPAALEAAVVSSAGGTALEFCGTSVSYPQLDDESTRIARQLIARGAGPETCVVIALPRSITAITMLWAVAKTGAAFVPIDPRYPSGRIEHMLTDSGATLGISDSVRADGPLWLHPDDLDPNVGSAFPITDDERTLPLRPEHPAYLIYTSGSTGMPKGVTVTHAGLVNLTAEIVERTAVDSDSRTVQFASSSFDASIFELLIAIGAGSTMVIVPPDIYGGVELTKALAGVTHAVLTPAAAATVDPTALDDLRVLVVGGEPCSPALVRAWAGRVAMFNAYGPTETTVISTMSGPIQPPVPVDQPVQIDIGGPTRGVDAYVLDARLHPVSAGVIGELYLSGDALARGYHRKPGITSAAFVAAPFSGKGSRIYRTGDRVRMVHGALEYVGRTDHQVKVRGFRIELGEIDTVIARHPGVEQSVSVVHSDSVVSYVVSRSFIDPASVIEHARNSLPTHMVPSAVTVIDRVPLTPAGKIDRTALPAPVFATRPYVAPRTDSEVTVADVFAAVFTVDQIGVDENFFDLGGNSLIATRVVGRINERAGTALPVRSLFESPTVAGLAAALDVADRSSLPALQARPRPDRIPLSAAQTRMWLLNQADPGSAAYNIALAVRLTGTLDPAALSLAVRDVLNRHESLRTVYPASGEPHQVILTADDVDLDLTPRRIDERSVLAETAAILGRGFDVTAAVPLRGALLRTGETHYVLVLVVHHIAADGVSMGPLARDVVAAYAARLHGAPAPWEPLPIQYADFALWQGAVLGSPDDPNSVAARQLDYWRSNLAGLPDVLELPTDRPRPAVASQRGAQVKLDIDAETLAAVRSLAHRHSASVFMVLNAVYAALLARLSGTSDIAIGTTVAGRGAGALDDVVGMFVGTLVLRSDIRAGESFENLLERVRQTNLSALEHADIPFDKVVEAIRPARATSHSPLFQTLLAYEPARPSSIELPGLVVSEFPYESGVTRFDLALTFTEAEDGLLGALRYSTDLFDSDTVTGFARRFSAILVAALADPTLPVGDVDILDDRERAALVPVRGPKAVQPQTLSQLIDVAVQSNPDGIALRWKGRDHTYREADEAATRLARVLLGYGIGPENVVALGLSRSVESVIAVWAVAKTGAAYVPVDPAYPADRLAHMVTDSGAVMGITTVKDHYYLPTAINWLEIDSAETLTDLRRAPHWPIESHDLAGAVELDSAAYMIYTSGSTGLPKGVVVSHRGLANLTESRRQLHRIEKSSRFLHNTSPSFDMAVGEMVSALSAAATLVLSPPEILGGDELADFIRSERVTHTLTTPSTLSSLDPAGLDCLEVVCVGGEACSPELVARWAPGRVMLNGYGPTEATDISTLGEIASGAPIDIGSPLIGFEALVLDARLHPVPVGVPGELYVAGPAIARGYHGRPELTGVRFVANPYGEGRLYRTGDIVRWTAAGTLRYSGRGDTQVKIRGFRIELGEIDAALSTHPNVDFAVTVGRPGPSDDSVLVSYVLGNTDGLREYLRKLLPGYMVPAAVVSLDSVPRTPTGKLDIGALPAPEFTRARGEHRPPSTTTEEIVAAAFSKVLQVNDIGVEDDFFELGGSSLTAMRVLSAVREATGTSVSLQSLLASPTTESIAALIDSGDSSTSSFDVVFPIKKQGTGTPLFAIHPIVGLSWCYSGLQQYTERPIYGIQTPPPTELPDTLNKLAQRYIDEIEKISPEGPYHLLGWSLGGAIAHAMAVLLRAQGKSVGSLTLLDSHAVQQNEQWNVDLPASDLLEAVGVSMEGITDQLISLDSLPALVAGSSAIDSADVQRLVDAARHNHDLAVRHHPGVYDGDILFISAGLETQCGLATWRPYVCGDIAHFSVQHTHWQMTSAAALNAVGPLIGRYISQTGTHA